MARFSRPGATRNARSTIGMRSVSSISVNTELASDPRPPRPPERPAGAAPGGCGGSGTACVSDPRAKYNAALSAGFTALRLSMMMIMGFAFFSAIRLSMITST
jgi:hypothetical protein